MFTEQDINIFMINLTNLNFKRLANILKCIFMLDSHYFNLLHVYLINYFAVGESEKTEIRNIF
jgi:hypothetical protein